MHFSCGALFIHVLVTCSLVAAKSFIRIRMGDLPKLKKLYIHYDRLSYFPLIIEKLENLEILHIQNNYFTEFPKEILSLTRQRDLDISFIETAKIPLNCIN